MTDHSSPSSPLIPSSAPVVDPVPAAEASPPLPKKRSKVRSAWIGFAGRVTAQLIGAMATVGLGYAVVTTHAVKKAELAAATATPASLEERAEPAAAKLVRTHRA